MTVPYPKAIEEFPVVRQSLLANFDNCQLSSFWETTLGSDWGTAAQGRGRIFHEVAAEALRLMIRHGEPTIDADVVYGILDEKIRQRDIPVKERVAVPAKERKDLRWVCTKWAIENSFSIEKIAAIEERILATVRYEVPGFEPVERTLTGKPDVLMIDADGDATVLDWKDTWAMPAASEVSDGGYFQQRFYAMLVFAQYPSVRSVTLREFYVRYSEPREARIERSELRVLEEEFSAGVEQFDRAVQEYLDLVEAKREERGDDEGEFAPQIEIPTSELPFVPTNGSHCGYCLKPYACPIRPLARGEGKIEDRETAERIASELLVAKAVAKQHTAALRNYVSLNGPVPIKDAKRKREFGFQESDRTARPDQGAVEAAIERVEGLLEDGAKLTDKQVEAIVGSLFKTDKTTRFSDYEIKDTSK